MEFEAVIADGEANRYLRVHVSSQRDAAVIETHLAIQDDRRRRGDACVIERADGRKLEHRLEVLGDNAHAVAGIDIDSKDATVVAAVAGREVDPPESLRERQHSRQLGMTDPPRVIGLDRDQQPLAAPSWLSRRRRHRNRKRLSRELR
jgi:hypothetical protein